MHCNVVIFSHSKHLKKKVSCDFKKRKIWEKFIHYVKNNVKLLLYDITILLLGINWMIVLFVMYLAYIAFFSLLN